MCRCDGFGSHWVARKTAGGGPSCATFKYNPTVRVTVERDCTVVATLFQPDVRPMFHPDADDMENKLATVYISGGDRAKPEEILSAMAWNRQMSGTVELKHGLTYEITASTFAPGMQGAFWIVSLGNLLDEYIRCYLNTYFKHILTAHSCQVMSGHGLVMTPKPFETPSDEEADIMQENIDPYGCCSGCHNTLDGPYYQTSSVRSCRIALWT